MEDIFVTREAVKNVEKVMDERAEQPSNMEAVFVRLVEDLRRLKLVSVVSEGQFLNRESICFTEVVVKLLDGQVTVPREEQPSNMEFIYCNTAELK